MTAFHQMGLQPDDLLDAVESWANQRLRQLSPQVRGPQGYGSCDSKAGDPCRG